MTAFLKEREYRIKFGWCNFNNKIAFAVIDPEHETITINYEYFLSSVFIHEFLHYKFPEASEKEIEKKTDLVILGLSKKKMIKLAKLCLENV